MLKERAHWIAASLGSASLFALVGVAQAAPTDPNTATLGEIIVTAQKREESLSKVPMSITAVTGEQLQARRISSPEDLSKIVPGFHFEHSITGTPVYSIRGIGFNDTAAAARPTVSVYVDQAPLPFSVETLGVGLDLERVEVLKGPQGTLFGQNSTGGAINYIAARPTATFQAGAGLTYGRFNTIEMGGFVSGPLTHTLSARIAVRHESRDAWQRSQLRDDRNGRKDLTIGRILLDWEPSSKLSVNFNLNGWVDHSDSQAAQFLSFSPTTPAFASRIPALYRTAPPAPHKNNVADWTPNVDYSHNDKFVQGVVRADYKISDGLTVTSLSSLAHFDGRYRLDPDGSPYLFFQFGPASKLTSLSQELRVAGDISNAMRVIVGVNYEHDKIYEDLDEVLNSTASFGFSALPGGPAQFTHVHPVMHESANTYAAFANLDYDVLPQVTLHGGVRYTEAKTRFSGCTYDAGEGFAAAGFSITESLQRARFGLGPIVIPPGGCQTFLTDVLAPGVVHDTLKEHNVSWRAGADWKPTQNLMIYGNVSKGYKAGSFPILGATFSSQLAPAVQESVLASEVGFKLTTLERRLRLDGAAFSYDYKNKQVFGVFNDPVFGPLKREVNVPKSRLYGGEIQFTWTPSEAFTLTGGGTYLHSRIKGQFLTLNLKNQRVDVSGESFPFTPKWQGTVDAEYRWELTPSWQGFVGASATAKSKTNAELGALVETRMRAYTTVDLRVGARNRDKGTNLSFWVQNVANTYYWNNATIYHDTFVRFTGMPRMFGVSLDMKFD